MIEELKAGPEIIALRVHGHVTREAEEAAAGMWLDAQPVAAQPAAA